MESGNDPHQMIAPVVVTMVGTGDGGGSPLTSGTQAKTPDHQPDLVVNVVTPALAIAVRFVNLFLTTIVATMGLLKDLVTIFSGLERKFPLASGSV